MAWLRNACESKREPLMLSYKFVQFMYAPKSGKKKENVVVYNARGYWVGTRPNMDMEVVRCVVGRRYHAGLSGFEHRPTSDPTESQGIESRSRT